MSTIRRASRRWLYPTPLGGASRSGDSLAALDNADHQILIKPWPLGRNSKLGDDQFNRDDFTIDYTARTVTCPNSVTVDISVKGNATFGIKCRGCPIRSRCTSAIDGKTFVVSEHDGNTWYLAPTG